MAKLETRNSKLGSETAVGVALEFRFPLQLFPNRLAQRHEVTKKRAENEITKMLPDFAPSCEITHLIERQPVPSPSLPSPVSNFKFLVYCTNPQILTLGLADFLLTYNLKKLE